MPDQIPTVQATTYPFLKFGRGVARVIGKKLSELARRRSLERYDEAAKELSPDELETLQHINVDIVPDADMPIRGSGGYMLPSQGVPNNILTLRRQLQTYRPSIEPGQMALPESSLDRVSGGRAELPRTLRHEVKHFDDYINNLKRVQDEDTIIHPNRIANPNYLRSRTTPMMQRSLGDDPDSYFTPAYY